MTLLNVRSHSSSPWVIDSEQIEPVTSDIRRARPPLGAPPGWKGLSLERFTGGMSLNRTG